MNLADCLVASVILAIASSCSLQLWASSASSAAAAEQRQQQFGQLEIALLASQARLAALAAEPVAGDCTAAAHWLAGHLQSQPLPAGVSRVVSSEAGALVRVQVAAAELGPRQRWLSPAAYGLCGPAATSAAPTTEEQTDATL